MVQGVGFVQPILGPHVIENWFLCWSRKLDDKSRVMRLGSNPWPLKLWCVTLYQRYHGLGRKMWGHSFYCLLRNTTRELNLWSANRRQRTLLKAYRLVKVCTSQIQTHTEYSFTGLWCQMHWKVKNITFYGPLTSYALKCKNMPQYLSDQCFVLKFNNGKKYIFLTEYWIILICQASATTARTDPNNLTTAF